MPLTEEHRSWLLVQSIVDYGIFMLDLDGCVISWNRGAELAKGYRGEEILGQSFEKFFLESDRQAGLPAEILRSARESERFQGEGWSVRKDGSMFWASLVVDPATNDVGQLVGYAVVVRDLTTHMRLDEKAKRTEEQFRLLVQGVEDYAIYMLDKQGNVSSWNTGAQRIKGYAPAEIIGKNFSVFYTPEDRAVGQPERGLAIARETGRFENEGRRIRKDGSAFWAHVLIDRILDEEGHHIGFAKITRDVTEKRQAEEDLARAQEALFQSQKLEAIGQLTGGVAHDFNNLLMAVQANLELLSKRLKEDPQGLAMLNNAMAGAQRGAALTQRMLAFARRQDLTPTSVDLKALFNGMETLIQRSVGPLVTIETKFSVGLPAVKVDHNQFELALLNVAMNARDAMLGTGAIIIKAHKEVVTSGHPSGLLAGTYVCLSIEDSGEGMDAQTLARAAEPFFTTKGVGKGTGLGLSMVHGLMEQSGGRLTLQSEVGNGTRVMMWLPIAHPGASSIQIEVPDIEMPNTSHALRILLVDDDPLIRTTMSMLLEDLGHEAIEVDSGQQALQTLAEDKAIDLVITDHAMPSMTGLQLINKIKQTQPTLPIVLASGYAEIPSGERLDIPQLSKPFRVADLREIIGQICEKRVAQKS